MELRCIACRSQNKRASYAANFRSHDHSWRRSPEDHVRRFHRNAGQAQSIADSSKYSEKQTTFSDPKASTSVSHKQKRYPSRNETYECKASCTTEFQLLARTAAAKYTSADYNGSSTGIFGAPSNGLSSHTAATLSTTSLKPGYNGSSSLHLDVRTALPAPMAAE